MFEVIRRLVLTLIVGSCIVGLSLHFVVESLRGMPENSIDRQMQKTSDSHEEDQFVLSESGNSDSPQQWISRPFISKLKIVSRPLPPPHQPPKSI
jgi:hypothetical protein